MDGNSEIKSRDKDGFPQFSIEDARSCLAQVVGATTPKVRSLLGKRKMDNHSQEYKRKIRVESTCRECDKVGTDWSADRQ